MQFDWKSQPPNSTLTFTGMGRGCFFVFHCFSSLLGSGFVPNVIVLLLPFFISPIILWIQWFFLYWYDRYTNKCKKYSIDLDNKRNKQVPCNNALGTRSFNVWHIVSSFLCAFVSLSLSSNVVKVWSLYDQSNKISQHAYSLYNRW